MSTKQAMVSIVEKKYRILSSIAWNAGDPKQGVRLALLLLLRLFDGAPVDLIIYISSKIRSALATKLRPSCVNEDVDPALFRAVQSLSCLLYQAL
jgi:hypothetical protein